MKMVYCFSNLESNQEFLFPIKDVFTISLFAVTIFYTTAMVEDVGLEPLFHIPNVACYHYTTSSIYGISYWDSNPYLAVLETAVLPIKLRILVGIEGLEPPTRCLRDTYYTNLVIFPFGDNGQIRTDEQQVCNLPP